MTRHEENIVHDRQEAVELAEELPSYMDRTSASFGSEKDFDHKLEASLSPEVALDAEDRLYTETGKEKVLETAEDFATALVSLDDDPTLPVHTLRMWFAGLGLAAFGAILGMLFQFRPQVISVSALFLQLLAYMIGKVFEFIIPSPGSKWHNGGRFWNFLNPGPFNIKEHVAAQIMANTAATAALACFVFASDDLFYNISVNAMVLLECSVSLSPDQSKLADLQLQLQLPLHCRIIPRISNNYALPTELDLCQPVRCFTSFKRRIIARKTYIAPLLGSFNIVCLAVRDSNWVSYIFGGAEGNEGMGLLGFGLDWANITSAPFYQPLVTQISVYVGWALNYLILPLVFAGNAWHSKNFPFISQNLFFENGTIYDQNAILNPDFSLNRTAYEIAGQPWQSGSTVIYNLGLNLSIGATFVHILLWHGKELYKAFADYFQKKIVDDHHYKKMKPLLLLITLVVLNLGLSLLNPDLTVLRSHNLFQMLGAALVPGSSQANMYFQLYSSVSLTQATSMLSDLKLGQYTKLPPRATFVVQIAGTMVGAILNYVIMQIVVNNERTILLSNQGTRVWSGQQIQSFNANAVLWGALGKEIYGPHGPYFIIPIGIVIGLALPVIPWVLYKRFKWNWLRFVNTAILSSYIGDLAGGTNGYINTWMAIGLTSHFYIRRYRAGWFRKYNYLFGAAIDGGAQIFVFIFSFALAGAGGVTVAFPNWALNPMGNALELNVPLGLL
ncbi:hypothetical protein Clacol_008244 [Clathrus columnatus]|uniref:Uncharacterized protein n=1 Tax=Clathrus columnatus TaxID=1419009 RepID=A0AAV5AJQ7_9AGAM|nr:hypothetical protein Clacol_008244 [Clathrus columnatus]